MLPVDTYFLPPTPYPPNSQLPVLHYRNVLPSLPSEETVTQFLTANQWEKRVSDRLVELGGHITIRHFHPNSHECYGIFRGSSKLLLGAGAGDRAGGFELSVQAGDVIVLPAGIAHSCVESSEDYQYIGVYPQRCPRWRNEMGNRPIDLRSLREETERVAIPEADPIYGAGGPLLALWKKTGKAKL